MTKQPPAITAAEYQARRTRVLQHIGDEAIAIIFAAKPVTRSRDTEYAFRQNSDFYYLSGFPESEAVLVLAPGEKTPVMLFCQAHDKTAEIWTGARIGQQAAVEQYGMDAAFTLAQLAEKMPALLANKKQVYTFTDQAAALNAQIKTWCTQSRAAKALQTQDISAFVGAMRQIKSEAEIAHMRYVAHVSAKAHIHAMQVCRPGQYEYQLAAAYQYQFAQGHAPEVAYLPIVGGGKNACVLHYIANDQILQAGDLVLVDAAGEYQNYCADITRTFPVNGRFTRAQRDLYDIVLQAYQTALQHMQPGGTWMQVNTTAAEVITQGLLDLNILRGDFKKLMADKAYRRFFMHGAGHWLGLDVHDVGVYKQNDEPIAFAPGMALTLEPGIYIDEDDSIDEQWWHTGIRIEDDILITAQGHEVLSHEAPILADDIEQLMQS